MRLITLRHHLDRGEWLQARREAERLIGMGDLVGADLIQACRGAARARYFLGEIHAAIKLTERALQEAERLGIWELIGKARYDLGEFYLTAGDYAVAQDHLDQFLADRALYPQIGHLEAWAAHNLGLIYRHRRQFEEALAAHQLAASLHQKAGDRARYVEALRGVIWCCLTMGKPAEALPHLEQIAALLQEQPDDRIGASLLNDWAFYYQLVGDLTTSTHYCAEAMVPGRPGVDHHILATACVIAGENAALLSRHHEAQIFCNLAEEYALSARHPALMNRSGRLRRHLHEMEVSSTSPA